MSDAVLGDIVRPVRKSRLIDISDSPFVRATELREKLEHLLLMGELDGGLPILRHNVLSGLIPAPDLEYALDNLDDEENTLCLMSMDPSAVAYDSDEESDMDRIDFMRYIDPVCSGILGTFDDININVSGTYIPRHPFTNRCGLPVLYEAGSAVSLCTAGRAVCRTGT